MAESTTKEPVNFEKLPNLKALGQYAKSKRRYEKISIKKLALLVGCSHTSIIEFEKGSGKINLSTAWRILDTLGLINPDAPKYQGVTRHIPAGAFTQKG